MGTYNPYTLQNKTVLITGASSGIGQVTAIECSKMKANVIITDVNEVQLNETYSKLQKGQNHQQFVADLMETQQIEKLVSLVPKLDGFANIAGIGNTAPILFFNSEDINKVYSVNLFAPMMLTKHLVKMKKINKPASIVYVASVAGVNSFTVGNGIYGTSKSALTSYMKFAAKELANKGIRCNSVNPGMVNTPFIQMDAFSKETIAADMNSYPLKRYGNPEEIAHAIIFLLSDASSFITGHSLVVDGGKTIN